MNRITRVIASLGLLWSLSFVAVAGALATQPGDDGQHQVWVCKYVGQPGDFETLKPGKQPIIVDVAAADAYVGADFADGQTHSFVIDLASESNTGQGERYTGEATCPTISPSPTPTVSPSDTPIPTESTTPSVSPSPTPSDEATPSPSLVVTSSVEPSPVPTASIGTAIQSVPLPPTDSQDPAATSDAAPKLLIFLVAFLSSFIASIGLSNRKSRR